MKAIVITALVLLSASAQAHVVLDPPEAAAGSSTQAGARSLSHSQGR